MSAKKKKILVVTGNRADYGLLKKLINEIKKNRNLSLKILVTGSHLIKKYGYTLNEIRSDKNKVNYKVNLSINSDTPNDISKAISYGIEKFSKILLYDKPDLAIVLGDRYEIFSFVVCANIHGLPIAHLHGGEITKGAIDDSLRHSITKMSDIHFVANKIYGKRVRQLGENPRLIFNVGGLGVDQIHKNELYTKKEIEKVKKFSFYKKNLIITYHPETIKNKFNNENFDNILRFLSNLKKTRIIFTSPNIDIGNLEIYNKIKKFIKKNKNSIFFESLGHKMYLSIVNQVDVVIGNSSSGLSEVPFLKKPTINVGERQKGRIQVHSVVNCNFDQKNLKKSLKKIYNKKFLKNLKSVVSPYGKGGAAKKILKIIKKINLKNIKNKKFIDLKI